MVQRVSTMMVSSRRTVHASIYKLEKTRRRFEKMAGVMIQKVSLPSKKQIILISNADGIVRSYQHSGNGLEPFDLCHLYLRFDNNGRILNVPPGARYEAVKL